MNRTLTHVPIDFLNNRGWALNSKLRRHCKKELPIGYWIHDLDYRCTWMHPKIAGESAAGPPGLWPVTALIVDIH